MMICALAIGSLYLAKICTAVPMQVPHDFQFDLDNNYDDLFPIDHMALDNIDNPFAIQAPALEINDQFPYSDGSENMISEPLGENILGSSAGQYTTLPSHIQKQMEVPLRTVYSMAIAFLIQQKQHHFDYTANSDAMHVQIIRKVAEFVAKQSGYVPMNPPNHSSKRSANDITEWALQKRNHDEHELAYWYDILGIVMSGTFASSEVSSSPLVQLNQRYRARLLLDALKYLGLTFNL